MCVYWCLDAARALSKPLGIQRKQLSKSTKRSIRILGFDGSNKIVQTKSIAEKMESSIERPNRIPVTAGFVLSASVILMITGVAKVWSASSHTKVLAVVDPIIGITFGHLMWAVGVLELLIAWVCLSSKKYKFCLTLIAWLSTNILVYRCALGWVGWHKPCSCLGNLTDALHIPPEVADASMKIILAYLLIGSYAALFWLWRQKRQLSLLRKASSVS